MAENETLVHDGRSANRWKPIRDRLDNGQTLTEAFSEIRDHFHRSLQRVWDQWVKKGVEPRRLFDAALNDFAKLEDFIRQLRSDRSAQLLRDVAVGLQNPTLEHLIQAFLDAAWHEVRNQLQIDCREEATSPDFTNQVDKMLNRMRRHLIQDISRFPRRPSLKAQTPDLDTQLGENLL